MTPVGTHYCSRCGTRLARDNRQAFCGPCQHAARDQLIRPPTVPAAFWETDQMRDAAATWHMGRVIYAYRNHPHHGQPIKQSVMAGWLGLTQTQISRMERGPAPEDLRRLVHCAKVLGIPRELLWFAMPDDKRKDQASAPVSSQLVVPVLVNGQPHLLPVNTAAFPMHSIGTLLTEQRLVLPQQRADPPAALDLDDMERVVAALEDGRRFFNGSVVDFFRTQLERCKADDGHLGPGNVIPLVLGILKAIRCQVRDVRPVVRAPLLSLAAEGAEFASWLYRDLRQPSAASYWLDQAMESAQEAGDLPMQGYVLLKKSQMAYEERDALRVLTLAQAAQYGPWQLPSAVRAEVTLQEARGLAMCGEPIDTVEQKLDEAHYLAAASAPGGERQLAPYYDEGTVVLRRAACYLEAGRATQAAALFGDVLARQILSRRDEGYFRARRAVALAEGGEPDEAAEEGLNAWRVAAVTKSQRTTRELARAVESLAPWSKRPGPQALRQALQANE